MSRSFPINSIRLLRPLLCLSLLLALSARAQDDEFSLEFITLDAAAGTESSAEFSLEGGIGSFETGTSSGGEFSTETGFWSIVAALQTPTLSIVPGTPGFVTIFWTPATPGFVLQETTDLSVPNWTSSTGGETNPVTLATGGNTKFYRLIKP